MADTSAEFAGQKTDGRSFKDWWTPARGIQIAVLALLLGIQYQPILERLVRVWSTSGDWSHGFLIPVFGLYYLYVQRHRAPLNVEERTLLPRVFGAGLMGLAFYLYVYCLTHRISYPQNIALIMSVLGTVLMVSGWKWTRWSWFAVAFFFFAIPLPHRLYFQMTMPLRIIAAQVSAVVLSLVPGLDAEARGAVVEYFYQGTAKTIDIEQACSGMRLLMTMSALGVAMAFASERPLWHRMIMILACAPIAIFCNIIRVTTTGFFVVFERDDLARGTSHTLLGLAMLLIAFSLYGGISYVLSHLFIEHQPEPDAGAPDTSGGGTSV